VGFFRVARWLSGRVDVGLGEDTKVWIGQEDERDGCLDEVGLEGEIELEDQCTS
jgi:hypothetical protein